MGGYTARVWHDEMERFEKTGQLDEGPCWCPDCLKDELNGEKNDD